MTIAEVALKMIRDGMVIGLGTGRAAVAFIEALGPRVQAGLKIRGVPTSQSSADLARRLNIPLTTLEDVDSLDIDFDGSDEVDPQLQLIKGLGGALVREKIVAAASKRFVVLVGSEKLVPKLGANPHKQSVLPVEVVPYGLPLVRRKLTALGYPPSPREKDGKLFVSDNGNYILDCRLQPIADPLALEQQIKSIPGVVDTGLFLNMADVVLVQDGDKVDVRERTK
jgi:ribose 5-phosphate isomerase A